MLTLNDLVEQRRNGRNFEIKKKKKRGKKRKKEYLLKNI
jgi:hypothetical protein